MAQKNILYAEDDTGVRRLALEYFSRSLSEVNLEVFEEGISLEKRLQKGPEGIDLVLTDDSMPCIDGKDIIKKYARLPGFEQIPFILCYGGYPEIGEQAVRDGAFACIGKSRGFLELIPLVKKALKLDKE